MLFEPAWFFFKSLSGEYFFPERKSRYQLVITGFIGGCIPLNFSLLKELLHSVEDFSLKVTGDAHVGICSRSINLLLKVNWLSWLMLRFGISVGSGAAIRCMRETNFFVFLVVLGIEQWGDCGNWTMIVWRFWFCNLWDVSCSSYFDLFKYQVFSSRAELRYFAIGSANQYA